MSESICRRHLLAGAGAAAAMMLVGAPPVMAKPAKIVRPEIFLLRGFADVFSAGLDEMGAGMRLRGIEAHVQGHMAWKSVALRIIQDRRDGFGGPVVLIGHSLGANAVIKIAETLEKQGIAVDLLVSLAATAPRPVPANVKRAVNYYFATHGWGEPLVAVPGYRGRLTNKDYSGIAEVGHFNIDKQLPIQEEIMRMAAAAAKG